MCTNFVQKIKTCSPDYGFVSERVSNIRSHCRQDASSKRIPKLEDPNHHVFQGSTAIFDVATTLNAQILSIALEKTCVAAAKAIQDVAQIGTHTDPKSKVQLTNDISKLFLSQSHQLLIEVVLSNLLELEWLKLDP